MRKSTVVFYLTTGHLFLSSFVVAGPVPIEVLYVQLAIIFGIFIILYVVLLLALKFCKIPLKWHVHMTFIVASAVFFFTVPAWKNSVLAIGIFILSLVPLIYLILTARRKGIKN